MRLMTSKSKNTIHYYAVDSYRKDGKVKTFIAEKIGEHNDLIKAGHSNPTKYAEEVVKNLTDCKKENKLVKRETYNFNSILKSNNIVSLPTYKNIGWYYVHEIFKKLNLSTFFESIKRRNKFDAKDITEYLVVNRFLYPGSKRKAYLLKDEILNSPKYSLQDSYRLLSLLDEYNDELQKNLFIGTKNLVDLETYILIYDCTNFYFETEEEDDDIFNEDHNIIQWGFRKYGESKENRPNPIVQMGLFTDKNGIPIAYSVNRGNINEQVTTIPLESRIIKDYKTSQFIYCSDGGLGSFDNRFFNTLNHRNYVVTQSLKKTEKKELDLIFKDLNWQYVDNDEKVSLNYIKQVADKLLDNELLTAEEEKIINRDLIYKKFPIKRKVPLNFLKEIKAKGSLYMDETIFITFSIKYYLYQKKIFNKQLERAKNYIDKNVFLDRRNQNDPKRLIKTISSTKEGECASVKTNSINQKKVNKEEQFHGFYAVATSLDCHVKDVLAINGSRWKIEQSFRILKSEFNTRPIFTSTPEHIRGHLAICYIALLIYRIMERKLYLLNEKKYSYTAEEILKTIKTMNVDPISNGDVYKAIFTGSKLLDDLEKLFNLKINCTYNMPKKLNRIVTK